MSGEFLTTIGDISNLEGAFNGPFLKGRNQPRVAMVGRSNVGKSTLINALIGRKLAQVSKEPGKTRSIHFYTWNEAGKIVADLPGYGFAKTSHTERDRWAEFVTAYLKQDENIDRALVLLDSRHGPTDTDLEAIKFLVATRIPLTCVFTKCDALKNQSMRAIRRREAGEALKAIGYDPEFAFWVSAETKDGLKKLATELGVGT